MSQLATMFGLKPLAKPRQKTRYKVTDETLERVREVFATFGPRISTPDLARHYGITVTGMHNTMRRLEAYGHAEKDGYECIDNRAVRMWRLV